jgi:ATP-dependent exoDNAse (exonuclease V) alpha subunit
MESLEPLEDLIMAARGETEVDLLIEGLELINALSGEFAGRMRPYTEAEW